MKKEAEKDKLTSCVQCSAVFCAKEGEKHSTEWCESLKSRKLAQFLIQSSHGCHVGNILVLKTTEDLEISPGKLVRDDILSVQLSLSTMKLAEIGVGEAVWVHSSDGSKSVALVQPIDHLPIFTCQVKPKLVSCGFLLLQKSESPVLEAKDIQIEFFKKKAFIRDSNFHRVLLLKFLERPVYSGQIVVVNYFAQRVELKLKVSRQHIYVTKKNIFLKFLRKCHARQKKATIKTFCSLMKPSKISA